MDILEEGLERKATKIYFKQSVKEILDNQKTQSIKNVLNTLDLLVEDDESRKRIRKSVLDNINDLNRVFMTMLDSLVDVKGMPKDAKSQD